MVLVSIFMHGKQGSTRHGLHPQSADTVPQIRRSALHPIPQPVKQLIRFQALIRSCGIAGNHTVNHLELIFRFISSGNVSFDDIRGLYGGHGHAGYVVLQEFKIDWGQRRPVENGFWNIWKGIQPNKDVS